MRAQTATAPAALGGRVQVVAFSVLALAMIGAAGVWFFVPKQPDVARPVVAAAKPVIGVRTPVARHAADDRAFMDSDAPGSQSPQGDLGAALEKYQAAVASNAKDAVALNALAQVLVGMGRSDEAIPYFNRAIDASPDEAAYVLNRAKAEALIENWSGCAADYRRAQELLPDDYAVAFNLAVALHRKQDEDGAASAYQKAAELSPNDARVRRELAATLERLDRRAEAAAAYTEYLWLAPDAPDADTVKAKIARLGGAPVKPSIPRGNW